MNDASSLSINERAVEKFQGICRVCIFQNKPMRDVLGVNDSSPCMQSIMLDLVEFSSGSFLLDHNSCFKS